jgi:hypothetical protein
VTGTYQWNASYSGDANNSPDSDVNDCQERVVVCAATPAITTTPNPSSVTLSLTSVTLKDSATLSGGYYETGSITFTLVAPGGGIVDTETVTVSGNGTYTTPAGYVLQTSAATGTYQWNATYTSGNSNNSTVCDINNKGEQVTVGVANPVTISGTKYLDGTGNGFSCDDTGLGGVTINLYQESNGTSGLQTGTGGDTLVRSTQTASNGTYSFTGLQAGTYYVQEAVPSGYLQTGGGPNGSAGCTYYTISAAKGQTYSGNNFDDFQVSACAVTGVSFKVTCGSSSTTVSDLRGKTQQGSMVTVTFTVPAGASEQVTLVSYTAPGASFDATTAYQQQVFDEATGIFAPGKTYTLTVQIPNCYYQIDFVCGTAINQLGPQSYNGKAYGPDSSNVFYTAQGRLLSADNGGTQPCSTSGIKAGDFATIKFWNDTYGQGIFNSLNGGASATALGNWLASNFPHLYGAQADPGNACEKNLAGLKNSDIDSFFATLCSTNTNYAQILATAFSAYATDSVLAGRSVAYFNTSSNGSGLDYFNVGSGGSALGLSGSQTVLTIINAADQQAYSSSNFNANLSAISAVFSGINAGGINY